MQTSKPKGSGLPFLIGCLAVETAAIIAYVRVIRPWFLQWGASDQEAHRTLPGDDIVTRPRMGYTRAITIQAPIERVWQWVIQVGENRGGLYVNEWLAKMFGADMHNVKRILPEFQTAAVGDYVLLYPNGPAYAVVALDAPHSLVLQTVNFDTGDYTTSVARNGVHGALTFLLEPHMHDKTRLIVRMRLDFEPKSLYKTLWGVVEPLNFFMERQLLRGIKWRAEKVSKESPEYSRTHPQVATPKQGFVGV